MEYNGSDKRIKRIVEILNQKQNRLVEGDNITIVHNDDGTDTISSYGGASGGVRDVVVDGISVVQDRIAYINLNALQAQINDLFTLLGAEYWQDENGEFITDEYNDKIIFMMGD